MNPPDFGPTQSVADALNDLGCHFVSATAPDSACTLDQLGNNAFVGSGTQVQFCSLISASLAFPLGDTLLTMQLRDTGREPRTAPADADPNCPGADAANVHTHGDADTSPADRFAHADADADGDAHTHADAHTTTPSVTPSRTATATPSRTAVDADTLVDANAVGDGDTDGGLAHTDPQRHPHPEPAPISDTVADRNAHAHFHAVTDGESDGGARPGGDLLWS